VFWLKIRQKPLFSHHLQKATFWVAALTENASAGTNDINYLKKTFLQIANSYHGITGDISLNEAGDRKYGDYDFWTVKSNNSNDNPFVWTRDGRFQINPNLRGGGLIVR
jgi:ABC-type branched-subunit amino acid transport system substrate-binding protein